MVFTDVGVERLRDAITTDMTNGQAGTSIYPVTKSQGGLLTASSDSNNALDSKFKSNNAITVTHIVALAESNSKDLSEWEINDGTNSYNRIVRSPLPKTSKDSFTMIHTFTIDRI